MKPTQWSTGMGTGSRGNAEARQHRRIRARHAAGAKGLPLRPFRLSSPAPAISAFRGCRRSGPSVGAHEGAHVLVAVLAKEIQRPTQTSSITAQRLIWFPSRRRITSPTITMTTAGIAIRFHFLHSFESIRFSSLVYSHSFVSLRFSSSTRCLSTAALER